MTSLDPQDRPQLSDAPRRRLLQASAGLVAAQGVIGFLGALHAPRAQAAGGRQTVPAVSPYGPVSPVADGATGLALLALPEGFSYRSFGWTGDPMDDGRPTPSNHDGMAVAAATKRSNSVVLVRNHERGLVGTLDEAIVAPHNYAQGYVDGIIRVPYAGIVIRIGASGVVVDPTAADPAPFRGHPAGGTTNLGFQGVWRHAASSLGGTLGNCAGGPTPWGSWLTCEETIFDFSEIGGARHGYVFEPRPIRRSASPSPSSAWAASCTRRWRWTPHRRRLRNRGQPQPVGSVPLPAARPQRRHRFAAARRHAAGRAHQGHRAPGRADQPGAGQRPGAARSADRRRVRARVGGHRRSRCQPGGRGRAAGRREPGFMAGPSFQARSAGCIRMSRGEGIWYSAGRMFIVDTAAGVDAGGRPGRGEGAVWVLDLASQRLRALHVSANQTVGNNADNITVSPRGGVLLCEDGGAGDAGIRLLGLNAAGEAYTFARTNLELSAADIAAAGKQVAPGNYRGAEFAGACFDPGGRTLFMNLYSPGITVAIQGPWKKGNL
jgi:uncharacterized protein